MTRGSIRPRMEQVTELTRGRQIPLDPLPEANLIIIAEVLASTWDDLLQTHRQVLVSGGETEVNALLATRLNSLLDEDAAWSVLVRSVTRGTETMSYDGSHLEKRPDLSIHLTGRNPSFALIVECKLLDQFCRKRIDMYCNDGLARFIRGEYAWASREAFMLAYVRDNVTVLSCLSPQLAKSQAQQPDVYRTLALPKLISHPSMHLARSSHDRSFRYVGRPLQNGPGIISIWHLWLFNS